MYVHIIVYYVRAYHCVLCTCISLCTMYVHIIVYYVIHNTAQNSSDNFHSYPLDDHHSSDDVYWRGRDPLNTK